MPEHVPIWTKFVEVSVDCMIVSVVLELDNNESLNYLYLVKMVTGPLFVHYFQSINPLSANITKWPNTLQQFVWVCLTNLWYWVNWGTIRFFYELTSSKIFHKNTKWRPCSFFKILGTIKIIPEFAGPCFDIYLLWSGNYAIMKYFING